MPNNPTRSALEFWLSKCKHGAASYISNEIELAARKSSRDIQDCCELTHVIEYSALTAANERIAELENILSESVKTINEMQNTISQKVFNTGMFGDTCRKCFNIGASFNKKYQKLFNEYIETIIPVNKE